MSGQANTLITLHVVPTEGSVVLLSAWMHRFFIALLSFVWDFLDKKAISSSHRVFVIQKRILEV